MISVSRVLLLLLALYVNGCSPVPATMSEAMATPAAAKMASSLRHVIQRLHAAGITAANAPTRQAASYSNALVRVDADARLQVVLQVTSVAASVTSQLVQHQMQIEHVDSNRHLIQGWVFFERLAAIATLPFVQYIRPPSYAVRRS